MLTERDDEDAAGIERWISNQLYDLSDVDEVTVEVTEDPPAPCLCGELGPHWICGVRDPKAQAELEMRARALAESILPGIPYKPHNDVERPYDRLLQDVVLLMEEHGFTGWTPEGGFE